jgi:hypothetical protein
VYSRQITLRLWSKINYSLDQQPMEWYVLTMNRALPKTDFSSEEALELLHHDGWSLGHTAEDGVWLVLGKKGSKVIRASGGTLEEAWLNTLEQARLSVEMN